MALSALRVAVVAYFGLIIFLFFFQSIFLFRPLREVTATPARLRLVYEDVWIESDGARLNAWYVAGDPGRATVLFCHSNFGSMSQYLETIGLLHGLGFNVLIFDYRGFGRSTGKPSEAGTYADVAAARAWLLKNHPPQALIIWGRSLGGAHAARLAADYHPQALALESAFSSFPEVARDFFPYVPVGLIARYQYPTAADAARVECPTLVIHSPEDEVVNFRHGKIIFSALTGPKRFMQIRGNHNDGFLVTGREYEDGAKKFFQDFGVLPKGPNAGGTDER